MEALADSGLAATVYLGWLLGPMMTIPLAAQLLLRKKLFEAAKKSSGESFFVCSKCGKPASLKQVFLE